MAAYFKCMYCGSWHKDGGKTIKQHVYLYYKRGGTVPLSRWKRKEK